MLLAMLAVPALALSNETVYLEEPRLEIPIPEGWYGFTPETVAEDPDVARLEVGEAITQRAFADSSMKLCMITEDISQIIMVQVQKAGANDVSAWNREAEQSGRGIVDAMKAQGMDVKEWSWVQIGEVKYIFLDTTQEDVDMTMCSTIFNGFAINFTITSYDDSISVQETKDMLRQVVESSHFTETLPAPETVTEKPQKTESAKSREADAALHLVKAVVFLGIAISGVVAMVKFWKQWQATKIEDANAKKEKLEQAKTEGENMDEHRQ